MIKEITLPEISENVESGEVVRVLVHEGDRVEKEQAVLELETDKASFELPAPEGGRVVELDIRVGDVVRVGQVIMKMDVDGAREMEPQRREGRVEQKAKEPVREGPAAPRAAREAEEPAKETRVSVSADRAGVKQAYEVPPPASPLVRRLARELGVEITDVEGTGPGGRISSEDVREFVRRVVSEGEGGGGEEPRRHPLPDFSQWGPVERQPQSNVGRLTAQSTGMAWRTVPHVTQFDKADISEFDRFRRSRSADAAKLGVKLTITALLVKVCAAALRLHPKVNAALDVDRNEVVFRKYIHIGVAVDTDRGLLVPVICDADTKSLIAIAREIGELAAKARDRSIVPDEMKGACFTISNLGGIGGTGFTPIVPYPQAAILGAARAEMQPVFVEGEFQPRLMLPLSLSYDHRLVDGADGARFLRWVAEAIEEPFMLELEGGENGH